MWAMMIKKKLLTCLLALLPLFGMGQEFRVQGGTGGAGLIFNNLTEDRERFFVSGIANVGREQSLQVRTTVELLRVHTHCFYISPFWLNFSIEHMAYNTPSSLGLRFEHDDWNARFEVDIYRDDFIPNVYITYKIF